MQHVEELIDFILARTPELREAIAERRKDTAHTHGMTGGAPSGHAFISDPTAHDGMLAATELPFVYLQNKFGCVTTVQHPEKWLKVEATVWNFFQGNDRMREFYNRRYKKRELWRNTCRELGMSKGVYYAMKEDVLRIAEDVAIGYGALSPMCRITKRRTAE